METKLEINSLETLRTTINERIIDLNLKIEADKNYWVIAGYSDEILYAYVGIGRGCMGGCLIPCSSSPLVFDSECKAETCVQDMDYMDNSLKPIRMEVYCAPYYYSIIVEELMKTIKAIDSL